MPWFDTFSWLIALTPFVGLFAAGLVKRKDPFIQGDRVYRHDPPARISHWTHALGVAVCLASGIVLGLRFTPAFVEDGPAAIIWMNVHFVACVFFLFGTFFYLGNTLISRHRFKEHLPTKKALSYIVNHYGSKMGIKNLTMPPEEKYFESENVAYIMAVVCSVLLILSGLVKALAHVVLTLPEALLNVVTWMHDISAVLMALFFVAHVLFAALAPFAWATVPSMIFGWMPRDKAEEDHAGWMARMESKSTPEAENTSVDQSLATPTPTPTIKPAEGESL